MKLITTFAFSPHMILLLLLTTVPGVWLKEYICEA